MVSLSAFLATAGQLLLYANQSCYCPNDCACVAGESASQGASSECVT